MNEALFNRSIKFIILVFIGLSYFTSYSQRYESIITIGLDGGQMFNQSNIAGESIIFLGYGFDSSGNCTLQSGEQGTLPNYNVCDRNLVFPVFTNFVSTQARLRTNSNPFATGIFGRLDAQTSIPLRSGLQNAGAYLFSVNYNNPITNFEFCQSYQAFGSNTGSIASITVRVLELSKNLWELNPQYQSDNEIKCDSDIVLNINECGISFHYALEYQISDSSGVLQSWSEVLNYDLRSSPTLTVADYFPNLEAGQQVEIRLRYSENSSNDTDDYSDTLIFPYIDCSPQLVQDPPSIVEPTCHDSSDGNFVAQFDRELDAAQNERMLLYLERFNTDIGEFDYYDGSSNIPILTNNDINVGNSFTYSPSDGFLEPGRYRLWWVSQYNPPGNTIDVPVNNNGAESSSEFTITAPPAITFDNSLPINVSCFEGNDGSVTITNVQNGTAPYEYSSDNGTSWQSSPTFSNLSEGSYTLTVRDINGCLAQIPISVTIDAPQINFEFDFDVVSQITQNGADNGSISVFVVGGTGNLTYNWTRNGTAYLTTTVNQITDLGPGDYGVNVVDENNCIATPIGNPTTSIQEPPPLSVQFTEIQSIDCNGNTGTISAQGTGGNGAPYTYLWGDGTTNQQLANINAGTYTITVTDSQGISVNTSYTLSQPDELVVTPSQTNVSCNGVSDATINLIITGGTGTYTISWTDDASVTSANRTDLPFGEYFYTVTDENDCAVNGSVVITQPGTIDITIDNIIDPTTVGGTNGAIDVSVSGGTVAGDYTYLWTNEGGATVGTSQDIAGLSDGNYTLLVTDDNNCTATITQRVTEPQPLAVSIIETVSISCPGSSDGQLEAQPFGGDGNYTVEWFIDNNGTFESISLTDLVISNRGAATYRVIASDTGGDTAQFDYTLIDPIQIQVVETLTNISCFGGSDGAIDISVTGGTGNYTFTWTNSSGTVISSNEDIADVPSGTYNLSVVDENLCDVFVSFELTAPDEPLTIELVDLIDPNSAGATNGSIDISVTGGTPSYTYEWTDTNGTVLATSQDIDNLGEGTYTLTVRDTNATVTADNAGCITSENFVLLEPDAIGILIEETQPVSCFESTDGSLTATVTGGVVGTGSDYTYQWFIDDNGSLVDINQNTAIASDLIAGTYTLTITDDNGVSESASYVLNEPNPLTIDLIVTSVVSCQSGADGAIDATIAGGTAPYTYLWSNGDTIEDISSLTVGTYTLTVTDTNGCTLEESIEVIQPDGMTVENTVNPPLCNGDTNGTISLNVSGGNAPYTYLWSTGATTASITNLAAGNYDVTITDNEGCIALQSFVMEDPELLTLDLGGDRVLCLGQSHTVDATIDDTGASYNWTSDNGFASTSPIVNLVDNGTYTLTITNTNGCIATDTVTISSSNEEISADFLVSTQTFVDETIVVVDVSNPVPETVSWSFSEGTTIITQNEDYAEIKFAQEGTYFVTLTTTKGNCTATLTKEIIVQQRTDFGAEQEEQTTFIKNFNVYPNPSNGTFKADVELQQEAPISMKIIDLIANTVNHTKILENQTEYSIEYNLNLPIGTYLIILETPKGTTIRKIIVN